MTNWLVPILWIIGVIYMHYFICVECKEKLTEFAAIVKTSMNEMPGRVTIAVILVLALLEVISLAWPVLGLIDIGQAIYKAFVHSDS